MAAPGCEISATPAVGRIRVCPGSRDLEFRMASLEAKVDGIKEGRLPARIFRL